MRRFVATAFIFCLLFGRRHLAEMCADVGYDEVRKAAEDPEVFVIDVREPKELEDTGAIPNSLNIPLAQIEEMLKDGTDEDFKAKFNRAKPKPEDKIIFSCRTGRRSLQACKIANQLGFTKSLNFNGGWLLWESRLKEGH